MCLYFTRHNLLYTLLLSGTLKGLRKIILLSRCTTLSTKKSSKKAQSERVKVTLCQRAPRLPALLSLITFQFHPLDVISLSCFHVVYTPHLALKGLSEVFLLKRKFTGPGKHVPLKRITTYRE